MHIMFGHTALKAEINGIHGEEEDHQYAFGYQDNIGVITRPAIQFGHVKPANPHNIPAHEKGATAYDSQCSQYLEEVDEE